MSKNKTKGHNGKLSKEQELLLIQTRLAWQSDFRDCKHNTLKLAKLWKKLLLQLIKKDSSMRHFSLPKIRRSFQNALLAFRAIKTRGANKGKLESEIYDMFEEAYTIDSTLLINYKDRDNKSSDILKDIPQDVIQLLLNARLSREAEFKNLSSYDKNTRKLLWEDILQEIEAKATTECTTELTILKIQSIFKHILCTYKYDKSSAYFEQLHEIYGHDNAFKSTKKKYRDCYLKQVILSARLSREAEFAKLSKNDKYYRKLLWQQVQNEIREKTSVEVDTRKIQFLFSNMLQAYKKLKSSGKRFNWPYFSQFDQVFGRESKSENEECAEDNEELRQLVLNARLSREADFKNLPNHDKMNRKYLWDDIFQEVKAKATDCTTELTKSKIQRIFNHILYTYKNEKTCPYFKQLHEIYGNENELNSTKETYINHCDLKQLILNARLSREAAFAQIPKNDNHKRKLLWQQVQSDIREKAAVEVTTRKIQYLFSNMFRRYEKLKDSANKFNWPYFSQFDRIFGHNIKTERAERADELTKLVLNARLSREAEFKKLQSHDKIMKRLLWQDILQEVKTKVTDCTAELTYQKIQRIFFNTLYAYKKARNANGNERTCAYFKQLHEIYGHDIETESEQRKRVDNKFTLKQLILNARLLREAEFAKLPKNEHCKRKLLWQQVQSDVQKQTSEEVTVRKMQHLFANTFQRYKKLKNSNTKVNWPFYNQFHQVYGHDNNSQTIASAHDIHEIRQLVLNARLSREAEFQNYAKTDRWRALLWQDIAREVKEKAISCTTNLTSLQIKQIYFGMFRTYKTKKRYGSNDKSWSYFQQLDKVFGNTDVFEIFTVQSDNEHVDYKDDNMSVTVPPMQAIPITATLLKFLAKEANRERKMLQQIYNIAKQTLHLQIKEIAELRKLTILWGNKMKKKNVNN